MPKLNQELINKKIRKCFKQYTEDIDPITVINKLNKSFRKYGIRFLGTHDDKVSLNEIETIGWLFLESNQKIWIIIAFHQETETFPLNEETVFDISTTIQHEQIHHNQLVKRNYRSFDKQNIKLIDDDTNYEELFQYFGTPDEIDAYSLNILLEISFQVPDVQQNKFLELLDLSITWSIYKTHFPKFKKKLLKKVYKRYDQGIRWIK